MFLKKKKNNLNKKLNKEVTSSMLKVNDINDEEYSKLSRVSAGTVIALGVPAVFTGAVASVAVDLVGDVVDKVGSIAETPTGLLAQAALTGASEVDNVVGKAALYTVGAIAAVPTIAIGLATGIASGIIKLGAGLISLTTYALAAPFYFGAKGILRLGQKKEKTSNEIIDIEPENIDTEVTKSEDNENEETTL